MKSLVYENRLGIEKGRMTIMDPNSDFFSNEDDAANALSEDLKAMETELARQKDLYLHLAADFDNFRKRTAQEADRRAAGQKEAFILERLPVIDNLERALATNRVVGRWLQGSRIKSDDTARSAAGEEDREQIATGVNLDGKKCLLEWDSRYQVIIEPTAFVLLGFPAK
ncbi:MAG: nucleotide exchange factor GrpE [Verrucomicrobiota bacterium]